MRELAAEPAAEKLRAAIEERLKEKTAQAFDEVAQTLEDTLGREAMIHHLRTKLAYYELNPVMERRRSMLKEIPFRAVLTTNFDRILKGETPQPSAYRTLLRSVRTPWIGTVYAPGREKKKRPVLKLHGDLNQPESVVLTRRDYRRLLHGNPDYLAFLRAYLLSYTVLYIGFSFTDSYLNELRSELLTRLDQGTGSDPVAYAIVNDVSELSRAHYRKHEGIEILTYDTEGGTRYSGFDDILVAIHDQTSPVMRYRALLAGKRLLWVDPRFEANFQWTHEYFDMRRGQEVLDLARSAETAMDRVRTASQPHDLAVCFWGDEAAVEKSLAASLLRQFREGGVRIPVIVFAASDVFRRVKREVLQLGALGCYYRWRASFARSSWRSIQKSKRVETVSGATSVCAATRAVIYCVVMAEFQGVAMPLSAGGLEAAQESLGIGAAEIWTVLSVETSGFGFLHDRRPAILFERHIFRSQTGGVFDAVNPGISAPKAGGYLGGALEYDRLAQAIALNRHAALNSASWGIGQVMGFNSKLAGFASVEEMVDAMVASEDAQLNGMAGFVRSEGLHKALVSHDWAAFARGYNGSDFAKNQYDTRLAADFQRLSSGPLPNLQVRQTQALLTFLGFDVAGVDGIIGKRTRSAVVRFREANGLGDSEEIDNGLIDALREKVAAPPQVTATVA